MNDKDDDFDFWDDVEPERTRPIIAGLIIFVAGIVSIIAWLLG